MPANRSINLSQNVNEVLAVQIKDKTYKIPLATSLPYKKIKSLMKLAKQDGEDQLEAFMEFFKEYIPEEVLDELPMSALNTLAKAWAGTKEDGQTLGES